MAKGKSKELKEPVDLGNGIEVRWVEVAKLREQDVNPQVMQPSEFDRLAENIRERGALESLPYCYDNDGKLEIVSGHHRARAARVAGLDVIPVLVDTQAMTRSEVASKQIAHNALVGRPDDEILRQLLSQIEGVDDLLRTGLDQSLLPSVHPIDMDLATPHAGFEFRNITFTFLPHQMTEFMAVIEDIQPSHLVGVADMEQYEEFTKSVADFIRVKEVRHVGTVISLLTKMAKQAVTDHVEDASEEDAE